MGTERPGDPTALSKLRHELQTPVLAMQEALALLSEEVAGPLNEEQKRFIALSRRNLDRLHGLIEEILRLSKPGP